MDIDELLDRLQGIEWNDFECKKALRGVPEDAYPTVSAFANTEGGWIVFGVSETDGQLDVTGVEIPDRVQNDFLSALRGGQKLNRVILVEPKRFNLEGKHVFAFHVPESTRYEKPVYLNGDIRKSYLRRGAGDERCTQSEIERMVRDASTTRYDAETLALDINRCFDEPSIRWYRARFNHNNPGRDEAVDDITFLHNWGFVVELDGKLTPTRAGILLFGSDAYLRQTLPRMTVDFQLYHGKVDEFTHEVRWADRLQAEENLIKTWQAVANFYFKHSERPFSVDSATLRRADDPPDYVSFREAAINLLIHQDFADHTRLPVIRFFKDQSEFFNPGDAFASREQLLDPGDKEVRNPSIVNAFRRIGLSDQGGTGVGAIFAGWRKLGFTPPVIENNKADKTFRLRLPKEILLSEPQLLAQASLGVSLSPQEAAVFAYLTQKGEINLADVKGLTGLNGPASQQLVNRLGVQGLVQPASEHGTTFTLAEHLRPRFEPASGLDVVENQYIRVDTGHADTTEQVSAQVTVQVAPGAAEQVRRLVRLSRIQRVIVDKTDTPRSLKELMDFAGYTQRPHFKSQHLQPLLDYGVLRMTVPDKPTSSKQRYVLTAIGLQLKAMRGQAGDASRQDSE